MRYGITALILTGITLAALHNYAARSSPSSKQALDTVVPPRRPVDIRVRNDSADGFSRVVVGGRPYGDLKAGESSDYQRWPRAYPYSSVVLITNGKRLDWVPVDYVGEPLLKEGRYTYVLDVRDGDLRIQVEQDR